MSDRPFHHGNLRAALLDEAVVVIREAGVDGISLRDLARRAGVSHGAPRSHFPDKQALLDALAVLGFTQLATRIECAVEQEGSADDRFGRVARAYVDFAIDDAALMELMFRTKSDRPSTELTAATDRLFGTLDDAMSADPRFDRSGEERWTTKLLFAATMQGIASLVASRRVPREQGDRLVEAALRQMTR